MARTIYERYGGFAKIRRVVSDFYDRVLDTPALIRHFEHVDMRQLIDHQTRFVAFLTGGPASYSDEHLERVHQRYDITVAEFDVMVELLTETLEDHGLEAEDVAAVEAQLRRRQGVIVGDR